MKIIQCSRQVECCHHLLFEDRLGFGAAAIQQLAPASLIPVAFCLPLIDTLLQSVVQSIHHNDVPFVVGRDLAHGSHLDDVGMVDEGQYPRFDGHIHDALDVNGRIVDDFLAQKLDGVPTIGIVAQTMIRDEHAVLHLALFDFRIRAAFALRLLAAQALAGVEVPHLVDGTETALAEQLAEGQLIAIESGEPVGLVLDGGLVEGLRDLLLRVDGSSVTQRLVVGRCHCCDVVCL
mmetsp:Transcript_21740/g.60567  ORF Transcript_21740/g.60567 Transcript_21740/m.60567 type:complete len:234 (-) Transcript_21740:151-852(-)